MRVRADGATDFPDADALDRLSQSLFRSTEFVEHERQL